MGTIQSKQKVDFPPLFPALRCFYLDQLTKGKSVESLLSSVNVYEHHSRPGKICFGQSASVLFEILK